MTFKEFTRELERWLLPTPPEDIERITKAIGQATRVIMAKLAHMEKRMSTLDDLLGAVEAQRTKIDSLIALAGSLHEAVLAAMGETITPSQKMRIDAVFKMVQDESSAIDAAMTANTVQATAGAVSDGPSAADIKTSIDPGPAIGSTGNEQSGTGSAGA